MKTITADCICWSETGIWAINNQLKILFRYSSITGEVNYLCPLPDFIYYGTKEISIYQKKILLYPYWNKELFIFDIDKEEWSRIDIVKSAESFLYTYYIGAVNNLIYMYISSCATITELNVDTLVRQNYSIPKEFLHKVSSTDIKYIDGNFIIPIVDRNMLLIFNTVTKDAQEYVFPELPNGLVTVAYDGKYYWITGKSNEVIKWDKEKNQIIEKRKLPTKLKIFDAEHDKWINYDESDVKEVFPFLRSVIINNNLWLFPYMSNMILQIDINTGEQKELIFSDLEHLQGKKTCEYLGIYTGCQSLIIRDYYDDIYRIDSVTTKMKKNQIILNNEDVSKLLYSKVVVENREININDFIVDERKYVEKEIRNRFIIGEKIYSSIK